MARLNIVGMACGFGDGDLDTFERSVYAGESCLNAALSGQMQPEQLAGMLVKQRLLDTRRDLRVGVVVCGDDQPEALARRVVAGMGQTTVDLLRAGVEADDLVGALSTASSWLEEGDVDLTLILSVGTARSPELASSEFPGAALLVSGDALGLQAQAYAVIESVAGGPEPSAALMAAQLSPSTIGYLETTHWPPSTELVRAYSTGTSELACAVGSVDAGDKRGAAMVALIKAALCVHRRMLVPTLPLATQPSAPVVGGSALDVDAAWHSTPFFTVSETRPWFAAGPEHPRRAHVVVTSPGRTGHIQLSEPAVRGVTLEVRPNLFGRRSHLLPIVGHSRDELVAGVGALQAHLEDAGTDVVAFAAGACRTAAADNEAPYALSIVGRDREELLKELDFAVEGVARAFDAGKEWQTPRGSLFTASPLGRHGVTFVYPGVFNSYLGMGRDLFQHFPWLHERLADITSDAGSLLSETWLYPRSRGPLSKEGLTECMLRLQDNPIVMIESGSSIAIAHTLILRELFGVHPRAALGYSMGEGTMFWANGVWQGADAGSRALHASPLFSTMISGPRTTVKAHWGLGPDDDIDWATYLLKAQVDRVREAVAQEPRVYVTFVNLDNEVVIAGDEAGCRRVIAALDCHALPVPASVAIHSEAIHGAHDELVDVYTHPVVARPDIAFYSTATYDRLELDEGALANAMATMCCQPVDFPRLVSQVYGEGSRVFVELGPLATCTRRISRILRGKPHMVVALNPSPGDDLDGVVRALAALVSHRVPVNLSAFYAQPVAPPLQITAKPRAQKSAKLDATPVSSTPAPVLSAPASAPPTPVREPAPVKLSADAEAAHLDVSARSSLSSPVVSKPKSTDAVLSSEGLMGLYTDHLLPYQQSAAQVHDAFLQTRRDAQIRASSLIALQVAAAKRRLAGTLPSGITTEALRETGQSGVTGVDGPDPLFGEVAVREFASGDVVACFGPDFEIYRGRRLPRIPNGDLLMISRVMEIEGEPGTVAPPATLRSEFDVPADAWFYEDSGYPGLPPNIVLMEMALQPCGFLSAYLRSSFLDADADLYFRNLDGRARILVDEDLRGKTVCDEVRLLSSTRGQGAIIQTYEFTMSCEGTIFYEGWSSFGYFPERALARQAGLGSPAPGSGPQEPSSAMRVMDQPLDYGALPAQLRQVTNVRISAPINGSRHANLSAEGYISPSDWFFRNHFYQDPVMPGSLGVEAAFQAMVGYARGHYPQVSKGVTRQVVGHEMAWKYRGQITPEDPRWRVVVQLTDVRVDAAGVTLVGDASVWKDDVRIYQIDGMAVSLTQQ